MVGHLLLLERGFGLIPKEVVLVAYDFTESNNIRNNFTKSPIPPTMIVCVVFSEARKSCH